MAGISVGNGGAGGPKARARSLDAELNMVPMIDLLMVTIAFLLVTAVWSHMSRLEGSAKVPGAETGPIVPPVQAKVLHVDMRPADRFVLSWREGQYVVRSREVPHAPNETGGLAKVMGDEWRSNGVHTSPTDVQRDEAVLHTANDTPFSQMVAVMDAIEATRRPLVHGGGGASPHDTGAFALTLATQ